MNTHEPFTDTELEAMLARLAARGWPDGLEAAIMATVDTTPQRRGPSFRWPDWRLTPAPELRFLWYLALVGLLLALTAGALVVGSRFLPPSPVRLPALLEGMVTEEVEPGVLHVVNDGIRDLSSTDAVDVVAGYDGGISLLRQLPTQGFLRLGSDGTHAWPMNGSNLESQVLQVAPDGTLWIIPTGSSFSTSVFSTAISGVTGSWVWRGEGLRSTDGEAWSIQPCPGDYCRGATVAPDGTLWASWFDGWACASGEEEDCEWWVGYLSPTGWQRLHGSTPADSIFDRLVFTDAGDLYGIDITSYGSLLYRHEDGAWRLELYAQLVDVGPDGTIWQNDGVVWHDGAIEARLDGLARLAGGAWEGWTSADLPEIEYSLGLDDQFKVAPDGSLWFSMWRNDPGTDTGTCERDWGSGPVYCDGLARFDGETLDRFLPGQRISMDIAADGSAWVLAGNEQGRDLYLITPEAVAASE